MILLRTVVEVETAQIVVVEPRVVEHEAARFTADKVHTKRCPVPYPLCQEGRDKGTLQPPDRTVANHAIRSFDDFGSPFQPRKKLSGLFRLKPVGMIRRLR